MKGLAEINWEQLSFREKNDLVARVVQKWETKWKNGEFFVWFKEHSPDKENWIRCRPYEPNGNMHEAIEVIEETIGKNQHWGILSNRNNTYTIYIYNGADPVIQVTDESIPEAFCKAALLYKGVPIAGEKPYTKSQVAK